MVGVFLASTPYLPKASLLCEVYTDKQIAIMY